MITLRIQAISLVESHDLLEGRNFVLVFTPKVPNIFENLKKNIKEHLVKAVDEKK